MSNAAPEIWLVQCGLLLRPCGGGGAAMQGKRQIKMQMRKCWQMQRRRGCQQLLGSAGRRAAAAAQYVRGGWVHGGGQMRTARATRGRAQYKSRRTAALTAGKGGVRRQGRAIRRARAAATGAMVVSYDDNGDG